MTMFELFATELNVPIETDENGLYTGITKALAVMVNDVILSDNEKIRNLSWNRQKEIIAKEFYKTFPYMNSIENRIRQAVIYCAMIHGTDEDVRNDAANFYSSNLQDYHTICKALEFDN